MSLISTLNSLRRDYGKDKFDIENADPNPFGQFKTWFEKAVEAVELDPNAMALCTAGNSRMPTARYVLLKNWDERGFVFYTNYESRKACDMRENPQASLLFFWDVLERQIRIEGTVEKVSAGESEEYFRTRPYESRLGAWASKQSRPLASRFALLREVAGLMLKYPKNVPLPPNWGGYRLVPIAFEFWQGRESRLHDRLQYTLDNGVWKVARLYP